MPTKPRIKAKTIDEYLAAVSADDFAPRSRNFAKRSKE